MGHHSNIDINVHERDDGLLVVVEGELDLCSAQEFERRLASAQASSAQTIILDLDRVSFMDSAGAHVLLRVAMAERNRDRLALTRGSPQVQRLLELTGMRRYLSFVQSA